MEKYKIGYTQGTFDLFHVGHLNLIEKAKEQCDYLIVAVNGDKLVRQYKGKNVNIPQQDRARIVGALKAVDQACVAYTLDKTMAHKKYNFDVIFIGDDWKGNPRWKETEEEMKRLGVEVVYLPHTNGISTTQLLQQIQNKPGNEGEKGDER